MIVDCFFFFFGVDFKVIASCQLNLIFASVDHNLYYFCEELIRLVVFFFFFFKKKKNQMFSIPCITGVRPAHMLCSILTGSHTLFTFHRFSGLIIYLECN